MLARSQPLEGDHLDTHDAGTSLPQPVHRQLVVFGRARAAGLCDDPHIQTRSQQAERSLEQADVGLAAGNDDVGRSRLIRRMQHVEKAIGTRVEMHLRQRHRATLPKCLFVRARIDAGRSGSSRGAPGFRERRCARQQRVKIAPEQHLRLLAKHPDAPGVAQQQETDDVREQRRDFGLRFVRAHAERDERVSCRRERIAQARVQPLVDTGVRPRGRMP